VEEDDLNESEKTFKDAGRETIAGWKTQRQAEKEKERGRKSGK